MKLIGFAIASVVDVNTGNGLVKGGGGPVVSSHAAGEHSTATLLGALGAAAGSIYRRVAALAERRRQVSELAALSDSQLRDIGLHRGDVEALALGRADLDDLQRARRQRSARRQHGRLSRLGLGELGLSREAANEQREEKACCA